MWAYRFPLLLGALFIVISGCEPTNHKPLGFGFIEIVPRCKETAYWPETKGEESYLAPPAYKGQTVPGSRWLSMHGRTCERDGESIGMYFKEYWSAEAAAGDLAAYAAEFAEPSRNPNYLSFWAHRYDKRDLDQYFATSISITEAVLIHSEHYDGDFKGTDMDNSVNEQLLFRVDRFVGFFSVTRRKPPTNPAYPRFTGDRFRIEQDEVESIRRLANDGARRLSNSEKVRG